VADTDPSPGDDTGGAAADDDEETMYGWRVRSIRRALARRDLSDGELTVEDLTALGHLDQYHYFGPAACEEAARVLDLPEGGEAGEGNGGGEGDGAERRLLDVGSGVGGPARYLAATADVSIHGVELREPLVAVARELTARAGLDDRVRFTAADAATVDLPTDAYDQAVAWLVLLHLEDRAPALERMRRAVRPGGTVLVEDFALGDATPAQERALRETVAAPDVVGRERFADEFRAAGFADVATCDLTEPWTDWTAARYERFRDRRAEFVEVHGAETYAARESFYRTVRDLFADGAVEGVRVTARVPGGDTDAAADPLPLRGREHSRLGERDLAGILEGGVD
jgi:cyclopropane fatty-acyl-phospholipid synthase-like methyltransferase